MLKITDLTCSRELDSKDMAGVRGGTNVTDVNSFLQEVGVAIDFSSGMSSTVADVTQGFGLNLAQGNSGAVTNNQSIAGGNGIVYAPVTQSQTQANAMALADIGNVLAG